MLATRGLDVTEEAVALGRLKDCNVLYVADPNISVRATASVGFKGNTPCPVMQVFRRGRQFYLGACPGLSYLPQPHPLGSPSSSAAVLVGD